MKQNRLIIILYVISIILFYYSNPNLITDNKNPIELFVYKKNSLFSSETMYLVFNFPVMFMLNYGILVFKIKYIDETLAYTKYRLSNHHDLINKIDQNVLKRIIYSVMIGVLTLLILLFFSNGSISMINRELLIFVYFIILCNLMFIVLTTYLESNLLSYMLSICITSFVSVLNLNLILLTITLVIIIIIYLKRRVLI